jgi:hypothetical protein
MTRGTQQSGDEQPPAHGEPGSTPGSVPWPVEIWLVVPEPASPHQTNLAQLLRNEIAQRDGRIVELRALRRKDPGREAFNVLRPSDAGRLYRRAHRAHVSVLSLGGVRVQRDPTERPTTRGSVPLEDFIRYKAFFELVTRPQGVAQAVSSALLWGSTSQCTGPGDPRCLPFLIFLLKQVGDLSSAAGRSQFERMCRHRRSNTRIDGVGREWRVGPAHTRDVLHVAGTVLPTGFHWDVQSIASHTIVNGWQTWKFPGSSYANVHPDAFVRGQHGTKLHDALVLAAPADRLRTPRAARRRGAADRSRRR